METIQSNDLKKGDTVILRSGWRARIEDNKKGNTRMATVFGDYTEMGSIYAHDIIGRTESDGTVTPVMPTLAQRKLRQTVRSFF